LTIFNVPAPLYTPPPLTGAVLLAIVQPVIAHRTDIDDTVLTAAAAVIDDRELVIARVLPVLL